MRVKQREREERMHPISSLPLMDVLDVLSVTYMLSWEGQHHYCVTFHCYAWFSLLLRLTLYYFVLLLTLGGTQSLHTNSFDEAMGLPTEFSARIARWKKCSDAILISTSHYITSLYYIVSFHLIPTLIITSLKTSHCFFPLLLLFLFLEILSWSCKKRRRSNRYTWHNIMWNATIEECTTGHATGSHTVLP